MPRYIHSIVELFHKFFQNGSVAAVALLSILSRIVIVAEHLVFVLIVTLFRTKSMAAYFAAKVINVVLAGAEGCDITTPQCLSAHDAYQVEPAEVISLAKWESVIAIFIVHWKKLSGNYKTTVLVCVSTPSKMTLIGD